MAARFPNANFGPMQLRGLLRSRLVPGERLVGCTTGEVSATGFQMVMVIMLSLMPGIGHALAAVTAMGQASRRRIVVMTTRRILLLRVNRLGASPSGRGVLAELPLEFLSVSYAPMKVRSRPEPRRTRARGRPGQPPSPPEYAVKAASVQSFSLVDIRTGGRVNLTISRSGRGGAARLREALVALADLPEGGAVQGAGRHVESAGNGTSDILVRERSTSSQAGAPRARRTHPGTVQGRMQE